MAKSSLVISVDPRETRCALIEDGIIAELHLERRGAAASTVGNVYLGKVTRVLPGLQAAFIEIGQDRAAFLHVEDLIRPDDFEAYLAGGRKHARGEDVVSEGEVEENADAGEGAASPPAVGDEATSEAPTVSTPAVEDVPSSEHALGKAEASATEDDAARPANLLAVEDSSSDLPVEDSSVDVAIEDSASDLSGSGSPDASTPRIADEEGSAEPADDDGEPEDEGGEDEPEDEDFPDMPGFTITEPGEPVPRAPAPPRAEPAADRRGRRRGRRGRGRGPGGDPPRQASAPAAPTAREARRPGDRDRGRGRGRGGSPKRDMGDRMPPRIAKSTPIREVVKEGQEIIVQVTKDPIGSKGARCSSHVSLPGRYVVYLPTVEHTGISKRIGSDRERARLREVIDSVKPPTGGLIVRTVAEGLTKKQLKQDVGYLVRLWGEVAKKKETARAPELLAGELDLVLKVARDLFTDEVDKIVIDDKYQYDRLCRFVEMFAPDRVKDLEYYSEEEPIFDAYGIEDEIQRALSRKVPLPSGGHLVIDQAEALTAIDVNTGRFVGKASKDMEETILKTNLEAVHEIAYQLRFRNIGGLIILDLIDMDRAQNREKVRRTLEDLLQKDKAKTTLNRISDLGLIEMTRKRTRESLGRMLHEPCFYCDGTGQLQSKETTAYEILREIRRRKNDLPGYAIVVNAHPAVAEVLNGKERSAITETENRFQRKITVVARKEYHIEQFDIAGR